MGLENIIEGLKTSLNDICVIYGHPTKVRPATKDVEWKFKIKDVIGGETIEYRLGTLNDTETLIYVVTSDKVSEFAKLKIEVCPKEEIIFI